VAALRGPQRCLDPQRASASSLGRVINRQLRLRGLFISLVRGAGLLPRATPGVVAARRLLRRASGRHRRLEVVRPGRDAKVQLLGNVCRSWSDFIARQKTRKRLTG